mmetsp:Transcript_4516/g.19205  ORF Transcript_4516/g.19205 Transcript_4516/m.19205 type:complete len:219 (-) Transcript_4516:146-802(-)
MAASLAVTVSGSSSGSHSLLAPFMHHREEVSAASTQRLSLRAGKVGSGAASPEKRVGGASAGAAAAPAAAEEAAVAVAAADAASWEPTRSPLEPPAPMLDRFPDEARDTSASSKRSSGVTRLPLSLMSTIAAPSGAEAAIASGRHRTRKVQPAAAETSTSVSPLAPWTDAAPAPSTPSPGRRSMRRAVSTLTCPPDPARPAPRVDVATSPGQNGALSR